MKATGGAGYANECFRRHADETLAAGKLLGCYHYARDRGFEGSAEVEAEHFISAFKPYIGKVIPFLDWEADALNLGAAWAKKWLDRVKAKTVSISKANVAAQIMEHLCTCPLHGYSQLGRHGPLGTAASRPTQAPSK